MNNINEIQYASKFIEKNALILVGIFFLIIILIKIILSMGFYAPFIYNDEIAYDSIAQNIIDGHLYSKIPAYYLGGGSYSLGYPLFLSISYLLSNDKSIIYHIMLAISAIITTSIIFPSYFILKHYCTKLISIIGSVAITTLPVLNFYSFTLMSESLFIPLYMFSVWFLLESYRTNSKKWELLTSVSVVYLYITRPTGLAMIAAFILAFIGYLVINLRTVKLASLIIKKKFLIFSFIVFLLSWLLISTYTIDLSEPFNTQVNSDYNFGTPYDVTGVYQHVVEPLINLNKLVSGVQYTITTINYLFLCSYLLLFVILFTLIIYFNSKICINNLNLIIGIYILTSSLLLIIATVSFIFYFKETEIIIGRYVEPIIPMIILFGIISVFNFKKEVTTKKNMLVFTVLSILITFFSLIAIFYNNLIINGFVDFVNNPALYSLTTFYEPFFGINYGQVVDMPIANILPATLIILLFLLLIFLIVLSFKDKRVIALLLIVIIVSSIGLSRFTYYNQRFHSTYFVNPIGEFLKNNTSRESLCIIDTSVQYDERQIMGTIGFWNMGNFDFVDAGNITTFEYYGNSPIYLISTRSLPYKEVTQYTSIKLYEIENSYISEVARFKYI